MIGKILLIGLDSATWRIIDPLLKDGRLPNLAQLIHQGTSGVMHSNSYSASPVVWTSIATGKTPERHGVEDFFTSQRQLKAKRLWEILSEQGETVGVYQFLVTWPPKPLKGFVVPGWLALDESTQPPELQFIKAFKSAEKGGGNSLKEYLAYSSKALKYGLQPRTMRQVIDYFLNQGHHWTSLDRRYHGQRVDIALSTDYFCNLLSRYRPSFATTVYYQADAAGHYYWKYMEPELFTDVPEDEIAHYAHVIPQIYCDLDAAVGRILKIAGDEYTIFVMSDHGMGPAVHPSGYLYRPKLASFLEKMGYKTDQEHSLIGLDFYLFLGDQGDSAYQVDDLLNHLNGLRIVDTGEQIFEAQITSGDYLLIRVKTARPELKNALVRLPTGEEYHYIDLVSTSEKNSGTHEPEGIFIAAGPGIKPNHTIEGVYLTDVAPTMLAALGMPVGLDMDGSVLTDLFEESFLQSHPVTYIDSYESQYDADNEDKAIELNTEERMYLEERLRSLGYLE